MVREFVLPLLTSQEEEILARRRSLLACESDRYKFPGLPRNWQGARAVVQAATKVGTRFLECRVVPEQPLLRIRRSSVTHGAVMLYDGEKFVAFVSLRVIHNLI